MEQTVLLLNNDLLRPSYQAAMAILDECIERVIASTAGIKFKPVTIAAVVAQDGQEPDVRILRTINHPKAQSGGGRLSSTMTSSLTATSWLSFVTSTWSARPTSRNVGLVSCHALGLADEALALLIPHPPPPVKGAGAHIFVSVHSTPQVALDTEDGTAAIRDFIDRFLAIELKAVSIEGATFASVVDPLLFYCLAQGRHTICSEGNGGREVQRTFVGKSLLGWHAGNASGEHREEGEEEAMPASRTLDIRLYSDDADLLGYSHVLLRLGGAKWSLQRRTEAKDYLHDQQVRLLTGTSGPLAPRPFRSPILANPKNQTVHQLYALVQVAQSRPELLDARALNHLKSCLVALATAAASLAEEDNAKVDGLIFPHLKGLCALQRACIFRAIAHFQQIQPVDGKVRQVIHEAFKDVDMSLAPLEDADSSLAKKARCDDNAMLIEFKTLVPYLDLSIAREDARNYPKRRADAAASGGGSKAGNLASLYWAIYERVIDAVHQRGCLKFWL